MTFDPWPRVGQRAKQLVRNAIPAEALGPNGYLTLCREHGDAGVYVVIEYDSARIFCCRCSHEVAALLLARGDSR